MPKKKRIGRPPKEPWTMVCFKLSNRILTKVNRRSTRTGKKKIEIFEAALEEYLA
jgi:hypothetical protein